VLLLAFHPRVERPINDFARLLVGGNPCRR